MQTSGGVTVYVTSEALTHLRKGYRTVLLIGGGERVQGNLGLLSPVDLDRGKLRKERLDGHEKATPYLRGTYTEAQNREGHSHVHHGGGKV